MLQVLWMLRVRARALCVVAQNAFLAQSLCMMLARTLAGNFSLEATTARNRCSKAFEKGAYIIVPRFATTVRSVGKIRCFTLE